MELISVLGEKWGWQLIVLAICITGLIVFKRPIAGVLGRLVRARVPGGTEMIFDRQHVASEDPEIMARRDAKVAEVEQILEPKLAELLERQTDTTQALNDVMALVKEALSASTGINEEAREETLGERILREVGTAHRALTIYEIATTVGRGSRADRHLEGMFRVMGAIQGLADAGRIVLSSGNRIKDWDTEVTLIPEAKGPRGNSAPAA